MVIRMLIRAIIALVLFVIAYLAWCATVDLGFWGYLTGTLGYVCLLAIPGWPAAYYYFRRRSARQASPVPESRLQG
jgi:hypothetical protein